MDVGRNGRTWSCIVPLLAFATACYKYELVDTPRPGTEIRARFTTEAAIRRSQGLDEPILYVDGRVVGMEADAIKLDVLIARSTSQFQDITIRDTVNVALSEIASITGREIATGRSILFAAGLGAGAALVIGGITAIVGGNEGGNDDNGPVASTMPPAIPSFRSGRFPVVLISIPLR